MTRYLTRWLVGGGSVAMTVAGLATAQPSRSTPSATREDPAIELRTVRFWDGGANQTQVLGMVGVPYLLATPTGTGSAAKLAYKVTMRIIDEKGVELFMDSVTRHIPASFRKAGVTGQEQLEFYVTKPGKYFMTVSVLDSVSGRTMADSLAFDGYAEAPPASDMLISSSMRADTVATLRAGEVARGAYRFLASPEARIDLTRPRISFLMEAYTKKAAKAKLTVTLTTFAGEPLLDIAPAEYDIRAGGQIIAHEIPLDGIPQGRYLLEADLVMDGKTSHRSGTFTVTDPEVALQRMVNEQSNARRTDEGYFTQLPEDSLDAAFDVLTVRSRESKDLSTYDKKGSETLKRNFLIKYWQEQNPNKTPGAENLVRIQFYAAIARVNQLFSEGPTPGWRTDRGRLIIKYDMPDDSVFYAGGQGAPILLWKWTRSKPLWAVFADRQHTKRFELMKISDDSEPGNLNWLQIISPATMQSVVEPFTGMQFIRNRLPSDTLSR